MMSIFKIYPLQNLKNLRGFTVIELLIVVALIALMATLAFPSYKEHLLEGERSIARTAILEGLSEQERYFTRYAEYKSFAEGASTTDFKTWVGESRTAPSYLLKATECDRPEGIQSNFKTCIKITAVNKNSDTTVGDIWMQSNGLKGCTGTNETICWK